MGSNYGNRYIINYEELHNLRKDGLSFTRISKELNIPRNTIQYHMNKLGYKNSISEDNYFGYFKYKHDIKYFESINSSEKAYILGFLYADGNNYIKDKINRVSITLNKIDKHILESIRDCLKAEKPLREFRNNIVFDLESKAISKQLINLGCVPKKSLILTFPTQEQVPKEFLSDFIRGYFDGDGSIFISTREKKLRISIAGTEKFLLELKQILNSYNIKSSIYKKKNIYEMMIFRELSVKLFYNYIYSSSSLKLDRKFNKFYNFFNINELCPI